LVGIEQQVLSKGELQVCQKQIYKFAKSRFTSLPKADLQVFQKQTYKFGVILFNLSPVNFSP
jgi:hypothetical protein